MPRITSPFWRRFLMLDPKTEWTARELRRQPELRHIAPQDPYFASQRGVRGYLRGVRASLLSMRSSAAVQAVIMLIIIGIASTPLITNWITRSGSFALLFNAIFGLIILGFIAQVVLTYRHAFRTERARREAIRAELRSRSIPICVKCGYEGGDIAAPSCPHCGAATTPMS